MKANALALGAAILVVACASTAPAAAEPNALASGAVVKRLDAGKFDSLPTGGVYVRVIQFVQPAGYLISSKQHTPGIVYVETGKHRLTLEGQAPIDLSAGQAKFHSNVSHTHFNPGPGSSTWYFIAIWPTSAHGQPLVDPIATPLLQSNDFSTAQLPQAVYSEVLRQVTLAPSGRSEAHEFGGLSVFFVLQGSLLIRSSQGSIELHDDQGAVYLPDIPLQEVNGTPGQTIYLEMLTTALGREFEVPLPQAPRG